MDSKFKKVAMVGRHDDPRVAEPMTLLVKHLTKAGIEVLTAEEMALDLPVSRCQESDLSANADLMIAIGGDGTMLYAGGLINDTDVPLLGINRGRLGFLADVTPEEMLSSVDHILEGQYSIEARLLLTANLKRTDGNDISGTAFNDVVLQRRETGRMVDFQTSVAGQFVNTHSGDGLIVATPTGSTAYALSCGGPIIEPQLDAVVIVPICPHTLTDRPIVIAADQQIEICLLEREETGAAVAIDGHSVGDIQPHDLLTISAASNRIKLIHPPGYDFYGILRSKLLWGRDNRMRLPGSG
ncbi:MAG: NAD(+) kinase [Gammaproteobacteria bacterium]|nr:NAD(+) kinase [Gammaproteobacteria bacterium]